jgi:hypothetical protein
MEQVERVNVGARGLPAGDDEPLAGLLTLVADPLPVRTPAALLVTEERCGSQTWTSSSAATEDWVSRAGPTP